jgi:hypothetical protein
MMGFPALNTSYITLLPKKEAERLHVDKIGS